jgi:hypothetical protein
MKIIDVVFISFEKVLLSSLIGEVGVYVIWDTNSVERPRYIGEGEFLKRFADHARRKSKKFFGSWDGYIGFIKNTEAAKLKKNMAKVAECLLLQIAKDHGRVPTANKHPGSLSKVSKWCENEILRLNIRGSHPFANPARPRAINKRVTVYFDLETKTWKYEADFRAKKTV